MKLISDRYYEKYDYYAEKIRNKFLVPISDEMIKKGLDSVNTFNEIQVMAMLKNQDSFCVRCGDCCRRCNPIAISKDELKKIAQHQNISYKKIKKKLKIQPSKTPRILNMSAKPCQFLIGKNNCKVYEIRPVVCRAFPLGTAIEQYAKNGVWGAVSEFCPAIDNMFMIHIQSSIIRELALKKFGEKDLKEIARRMFPNELLSKLETLPRSARLKALYDHVSKIERGLDDKRNIREEEK